MKKLILSALASIVATVIICALVAIAVVACEDIEIANWDTDPRFKRYGTEQHLYDYLVDERTGVVYLLVRYGITPILNADGTLVTKDDLGLSANSVPVTAGQSNSCNQW